MGQLIIAATPIGNLGDASARLREVLVSADIIAAEDTRHLRGLAQRLEIEISARLESLHEHNERAKLAHLIDEIQAGKTVVLVSDAGMPALSDPGFNIIAAAHDADLVVQVIPGPSAITTAVVAAGFATDRFVFEGFLHRKIGTKREQLRQARDSMRTAVFFDSPHRLADSLEMAAQVYGPDHYGCVCRELTKVYEEIQRAPLAELVTWARSGLKGEITLVLAAAEAQTSEMTVNLDDLAERALTAQRAGQRLKTASQQLAQQHGVSPKALYDRALKLKDTGA